MRGYSKVTFWRGVRAALLLIVGGCVLSASTAGTPAGPLWISESSGILNVATDTGQIRIKIPITLGIANIAVNDVDGSIWAYGKKVLHNYTRDGVFVLKKDTPIDTHGSNPTDVVADGTAGNLWMGIQASLYRFDLQGSYDQEIITAENMVGLALDRHQAILWAAQPHRIDRFDQDGAALAPILVEAGRLITDIAFDRRVNQFWVALADGLRRYDTSGNRISDLAGTFGGAVAPDGAGGLWIANARVLKHLDLDGVQDFSAEPFSADPNKEIVDLVADPGDASVWIASTRGIRHIAADGALVHTLYPQQIDGTIRKLFRTNFYADLDPPEISIKQPASGALLGNARPSVVVEYFDLGVGINAGSLKFKANGQAITVSCTTATGDATCTPTAALPEGPVTISAAIADLAGNVSNPARVEVMIDTVSPVVTISSPNPNTVTNQSALTITGSLSEAGTLKVNGIAVPVSASRTFSAPVTLTERSSTFSFVATDLAGNRGTASLSIILDTVPPAIPDLDRITLSEPENGQVTITGSAGGVEAAGRVSITNTRTGQTVVVIAASDGSFLAQISAEAGDVLQIWVLDAAANSSEQRDIPVANGLPPNPAAVAPPLSETELTPFRSATAFLYSGANPIQTSVAPGTITAARAAVLRGRVLARDGSSLSGVTITVKDHPEFGQTFSRADGMVDIAVNGGGVLALNYRKEGYLPAQRQIDAPWRDFATFADVILVPLDAQVTEIALNAATMQVARGSVQSDADGTRQATILFPAGTVASYMRPDGTQQTLSTMHVRATEYTVGASGPAAMPGPLPPTSAYTYAVEISVDEVRANGVKIAGKDVIFNQDIPVYVDNFLGFPTGMIVPTGYYDADAASWVPHDNGKVIKILGADPAGLAQLDIDGSGNAASSAVLQSLGISDAERAMLATLYSPGKSLWRFATRHFSTYDCNLPATLPSGATSPRQPPPVADDPVNDPEERCGSVIECQNQVLGERIPVTGTGAALHYRSDRVPGRKAAYQLTVQLSGGSVPSVLRGIELAVEMNGQVTYRYFPPSPNQRHVILWDGKDPYGRTVLGSIPVNLEINYLYDGVYMFPREIARSFGFAGTSPLVEVPARQILRIGQSYRSSLGVLDARAHALGGWTISPHHAYDVNARELYLGDGTRRSARDETLVLSTAIDVFAASGEPSGPGRLNTPKKPFVASDGSVYFADTNNHCVRRLTPQGHMEVAAGTCGPGGFGFSGDGGPATAAKLFVPFDVAVHSDGSLYIADAFNNRIRRVAANGIIDTVAGNGAAGFSGDGSAASSARLSTPRSVAVAPDGTIYIADTNNSRVRRVGPDGVIATIAGTGEFGYSGDGAQAIAAKISNASGVAIADDGAVFIADSFNNRVRRVGSDGVITTVAGTGLNAYLGDGGPATSAAIRNPVSVDFGPDGSLYIVHSGSVVRAVSSEGVISTLAGNGSGDACQAGNVGPAILGVPATATPLCNAEGVAVSPDGTLYLAESSGHRVHKVERRLPGFQVGEIAITSEDGSEIYRFSSSGRHLSTLDARTSAVRFAFGYDAANRLISIRDRDNNETLVERNPSGVLITFTSPDGQRTTAAVDANGYMQTLANAANEAYAITYTADGLLSGFTDPENHSSIITYHADGRLLRDTDAAGGFFELVRTEPDKGYRVEMTSGEGRLLSHEVENFDTGDLRHTRIAPDGTSARETRRTNGTSVATEANGTVVSVTTGPDPRFGMQVPVASNSVVTTPQGLSSTTSTTRSASLSDPKNLLSHSQLQQTITVNSRSYFSSYFASSRTETVRTPAGRTATKVVSSVNKPLSHQVTGFAPTTFSYDLRGRLDLLTAGSGASARTTGFSYYADGPSTGWLRAVTDAEGRVQSYEYDLAGRITKQTLTDGRFIQYGYDANGNLTSLTPPGRDAHVFGYTSVDLEDQYTPPAGPDTGTRVTRYDYNLDKDLDLITRPDGQTVDFVYNGPGRKLSSVVIPTGTYTYTYQPTTGQLANLSAPGAQSLAYSYDGFLLKQETASGPVPGTVSWTYDNNFWVTGQAVNGTSISFTYDNDGLLTGAGSETLTRNPTHGLIDSTSLGSVSTAHSYSSFAELQSESASVSGTPVYSVAYTTRDKLGRIRNKTETVQGQTHSFAYTYDLAGRLDTVTRDGALISDYGHDGNGNRTSYNGVAATYDTQDRLQTYGAKSYTYTSNGELLTRTGATGTTTYGYDVLGNLRSATMPGGTNIEYVIDGRNRRVGKKLNGTLTQGFLYQDQLEPFAELDAAGNVVSRFVYASKPHSPDYMIKGGTTYRIISDHLGSPRLIINTGDGSVVQRMDYDEFGNVTADTNPGFQPFGFAGGLYDRDTKLTRFGARDYDAETGRWTAKDPIRFSGGDSNLFGYVLNDPISSFDKEGRGPEDALRAINALEALDTANDAANAARALGRLSDESRTPENPNEKIEDSLQRSGRQRDAAARAVKELMNAACPVPFVDIVDPENKRSPVDAVLNRIQKQDETVCKLLPSACR